MSVQHSYRPDLEEREAFLADYVQAVRELPAVGAVYARDCPDGLHIQTVYHGSLDAIGDSLFDLEGGTIDRFPSVPVDFRVLNESAADLDALRLEARELYVRE